MVAVRSRLSRAEQAEKGWPERVSEWRSRAAGKRTVVNYVKLSRYQHAGRKEPGGKELDALPDA